MCGHCKPVIFPLLFQTAASRGDPFTYHIRYVDFVHEGLYTCRAGNFLGVVESSAYLEVDGGDNDGQGAGRSLLIAMAVIASLCVTAGLLFIAWKIVVIKRHQEEPLSDEEE